MIKVQELRLGNYIRHAKYSEIKPECWEQPFKVGKDTLTFMLAFPESKYYEPIPLTADILEKAGFKHSSNFHPEGKLFTINNDHSWYLRDVIEIIICPLYKFVDMKFNDYKSERVFNIQCVHQLQNLFFCLTGKELKIEL